MSCAAQASTDTDDNYKPANTIVVGSSGPNTFTIGAGLIAVNCTHSAVAGKTPPAGLGTFGIIPPTFDDDEC